MNVGDFLDGLESGGYWDDYCEVCEKETPHPEGACTICEAREKALVHTAPPPALPKVGVNKAESLEQFLAWWPEVRRLTEHTTVIGIKLVCEASGTGKRGVFTYGEV